MNQTDFDLRIGQLDRLLSKLVLWGKSEGDLDEANRQTLKHHAEDMIAAGDKILDCLGMSRDGYPNPDGPELSAHGGWSRKYPFIICCGKEEADTGVKWDDDSLVDLKAQLPSNEAAEQIIILLVSMLGSCLPGALVALFDRLTGAAVDPVLVAKCLESGLSKELGELAVQRALEHPRKPQVSAEEQGYQYEIGDVRNVEMQQLYPDRLGMSSMPVTADGVRTDFVGYMPHNQIRPLTLSIRVGDVRIQDDGDGNLIRTKASSADGDATVECGTIYYGTGKVLFKLPVPPAPGERFLCEYKFDNYGVEGKYGGETDKAAEAERE